MVYPLASTYDSDSWSPDFFFTDFIHNCINCVHNCEDHSSFDFISAVIIVIIIYDLFHMRLSHKKLYVMRAFRRKAYFVFKTPVQLTISDIWQGPYDLIMM